MFSEANVLSEKKKKITCCHDDTCQYFPSSVWRGEVVRQFAELVDDQASDGVCQDLRWQPQQIGENEPIIRNEA